MPTRQAYFDSTGCDFPICMPNGDRTRATRIAESVDWPVDSKSGGSNAGGLTWNSEHQVGGATPACSVVASKLGSVGKRTAGSSVVEAHPRSVGFASLDLGMANSADEGSQLELDLSRVAIEEAASNLRFELSRNKMATSTEQIATTVLHPLDAELRFAFDELLPECGAPFAARKDKPDSGDDNITLHLHEPPRTRSAEAAKILAIETA